MTFPQALKALPAFLSAGLDLVGQHRNVSDLRFMVQTELDLNAEGEIDLTPSQLRAAQKFLKEIA